MNVAINTILGITDISALLGFWRIKCLRKGIGVVLFAYVFFFAPMLASMAFGTVPSGDLVLIGPIVGLFTMVAFRMWFLYDWTQKFNAQNVNTNNSETT